MDLVELISWRFWFPLPLVILNFSVILLLESPCIKALRPVAKRFLGQWAKEVLMRYGSFGFAKIIKNLK
jgi:hypothetical protein